MRDERTNEYEKPLWVTNALINQLHIQLLFHTRANNSSDNHFIAVNTYLTMSLTFCQSGSDDKFTLCSI